MPIQPTESDADFKMMTSPDEWPVWPFLPIKKSAPRGWPKHGLLMNRSTSDDTVYLLEGKTLFDKLSESDMRRVSHEELRELINAGWVVD